MNKLNLPAGKASKIIYWIATLWLALGMVSTGIVQFQHSTVEIGRVNHLGYPEYLLTLLGTLKILGVVVMLLPKFPLLKEWAYAGFFFAMSGAIYSHIMMGDKVIELFGPSLLIVLTGLSWYFRPEGRRMK